jgi:hypothetical protein
MTMNFPNRSRSYDPARHVVRFWGHDRSMESSFYVSEDALLRLQPNLQPGEVGILRAFDSHREKIHAAAARVYGRGRKGSYELNASDF